MDQHHDPLLRRGDAEPMDRVDKRVQWAAVGVLLLLCGGIFVAGMYSGGTETQTALRIPSAQSAGPGPAPAPSPQR